MLEVVEGAPLYVFLHDDVALAPDAIRAMVERSFRENAGIVAPKLVEWDRPDRLLSVGMTADKVGTPVRLVEPGELDQEQHDGVRDVFVAPSACLLVRADLFRTVGGFDAALRGAGEDVDLCWRVILAGARVVTAPRAVGRHRLAEDAALTDTGLGVVAGADRATLEARARLRTILKCYSPFWLVLILPQAALLTLAETVAALVSGRRHTARGLLGAWIWNLSHLGGLWAARKTAQKARSRRDVDLRRMQARGSVRVRTVLRHQLIDDVPDLAAFGGTGAPGTGSSAAPGQGIPSEVSAARSGRTVAALGREISGSLRNGSGRLALVVWTVLLALFVIGSRQLLGERIPVAGQLLPFPEHPSTLLGQWWSGFRETGTGGSGFAPTAFAVLGFAGSTLLGSMGMLRQLLVLGAIPAGVLGAHRLARPIRSRRASLASAVVYASIPLAVDDLAAGRWQGLLLYAAAPWLLSTLLTALGSAPFAAAADTSTETKSAPGRAVEGRIADIHSDPHPVRALALPFGILLALVSAFVPAAPIVVGVVLAGLLLGHAVVAATRPASSGIEPNRRAEDGGRASGGVRRLLAVAAAGAVVSIGLLATSVLWWVRSSGAGGWSWLTGVDLGGAGATGLGALLRLDLGPTGNPVLGWAFLIAAALPLVIGRGWRNESAVRMWFVALSCIGVAWAGGRGWLVVPFPDPSLLLAPAAAAVALAAALGVAAFETDLPGYRFGIRQVVSLVAGAAVIAGALPLIGASVGGRWHVRRTDVHSLLSYLPIQRTEGDFTVLWVGDPRALPLEGFPLDDGGAGHLAYATSRSGLPDVTAAWPGPPSSSTKQLAQVVGVARRGETAGLGHLLAPFAVRYVIVPVRDAPKRERGTARPVPSDLPAALRSQIDLKRIDSDPALIVYENVAWAPARAGLDRIRFDAAAAAPAAGQTAGAARDVDLAGAPAVVQDVVGAAHWRGDVPPAMAGVSLAEPFSSRWTLRIGGRTVPPEKSFGTTTLFRLGDGEGGRASISWRTPVVLRLILLLQLAAWALCLALAWRSRRERLRRLSKGGVRRAAVSRSSTSTGPSAIRLRTDDAGGWTWDDLDA